ncbi:MULTISPECIES: CHASE3 domain-containing protein [Cyanophyceae]|uniref:histidine kinase n=1 Tax=Stenomitos frigidus AS-A4 TaxID=2933935 RepID=A0ABV0KL57_9CYAN|nr:CHASE3 domain-containing protein [Phormidium sp. FACHB-592]
MSSTLTPQLSFRRRLIRTIALPVSLMLFLAGVSIWQISRLLFVMRWVEHTDQVIAQANRVERLFSEVESGLRGYLLTGEAELLEPYKQAEVLVEPSFKNLVDLVSDNPSQGQRLIQVETQYQQWSSYIPSLIAGKQNNVAQPRAVLKKRNQVMVAIRQEMSQFIQTEEQLRTTRSAMVQRTTQTVIGSSLVLAGVLGAILAYFIWRQIHSVSRLYEDALKVAHEQTQSVQRSAERLKILHEIDQAILAAQSVELLAHETLSKLKGISAYKEGAVILLKSSSDLNETQVLAEDVDQELAGMIVLMTEQEALNSLECSDSLCYVQDISTLPHRSSALEALLAKGYHSLLTVPLRVEGNSIGDLHWFATPVDAFDAQKQEVFREVAAQLAIAIQQSRLRSQLQQYAAELEQRVAERTMRLQAANDELEAFSYTVAHDLRAPLRGVEGYASALIEDYGAQLDEVAQDYIHQVIASIHRMNNLVQDLLAYSHLSREEIELVPVSLTQVIAEAQAQLESALKERRAEITVAEPLPKVLGHHSTLVQVVVNLLSNAAKFTTMASKPQIYIWAEAKQNQVRLWVEDNGIGIEPQYQQQIFGVFERLHARDAYPGTGIGLAIVRKGVERLGGRSGVESTFGKGSHFWVELQGVKP